MVNCPYSEREIEYYNLKHSFARPIFQILKSRTHIVQSDFTKYAPSRDIGRYCGTVTSLFLKPYNYWLILGENSTKLKENLWFTRKNRRWYSRKQAFTISCTVDNLRSPLVIPGNSRLMYWTVWPSDSLAKGESTSKQIPQAERKTRGADERAWWPRSRNVRSKK